MAKTPRPPRSATTQYSAATRLEDVHKTISTEPLIQADEFNAFYEPEVSKVRGLARIQTMAMELERSHQTLPYKAFLISHPGVGKSTELTALTRQLEKKYRPIRFAVTDILDPMSFQPLDVVLIMMARIFIETRRTAEAKGSAKTPSPKLMQGIKDWFAEEKLQIKVTEEKETRAEAGLELKSNTLFNFVLGIFAQLTRMTRYGTLREREKVTHELQTMSKLTRLANQLLEECNAILREIENGREWLFIGEEFDKERVPIDNVTNLFITHSAVLHNLRTHMIFTIPIELAYSDRAESLPFSKDRQVILPDICVYNNDTKRSSCTAGRKALQLLLERRVSPALFAPGQPDRLIVASGGNIRDLFSMTNTAANQAIIGQSKSGQIEEQDVTAAINNMRAFYSNMLGTSRYGSSPATNEEKLNRLVAVYNREPRATVPDDVLFGLLRSRAVQEFNGKRWFGVHPLVVDVLASQGLITTKGKRVPGGTI